MNQRRELEDILRNASEGELNVKYSNWYLDYKGSCDEIPEPISYVLKQLLRTSDVLNIFGFVISHNPFLRIKADVSKLKSWIGIVHRLSKLKETPKGVNRLKEFLEESGFNTCIVEKKISGSYWGGCFTPKSIRIAHRDEPDVFFYYVYYSYKNIKENSLLDSVMRVVVVLEEIGVH